MKKLFLLLFASLLICTSYAQWNIPAKYTSHPAAKNEKFVIPKGLVNFALTTPILTLTPFTEVIFDKGSAHLGNAFTVGYSILYSPNASGVWTPDGSISSANATYFIGAGVNYGLAFNNGVATGLLPISGIVGWGNYGLSAGIDVLSGKPVVGFNLNLMGVPVLQSLTKISLK